MLTRRTTRGVRPSARVRRKTKPEDALYAHALWPLVREHLQWLSVTGYTADGVSRRHLSLRRFVAWCTERDIVAATDITHAVVDAYQRSLFYYRKPSGKSEGKPLTVGTQLQCLHAVKMFGAWLARERYVAANPAGELVLPKQAKRLPQTVLTVPEIEAVLATADPASAQKVRDRALLEFLYSTGVRRKECAGIACHDLDANRGVARIREGKGGRERVVPVGTRALAWLDKYLIEARPLLLVDANEPALFVNDYGDPLSAQMIALRVRQALEDAGIEAHGATHLLRHACATHMLENGADIRYIQAMLGHANLQTTEIYTHVSIVQLKAIHAATHPARLRRAGGAQRGVDEPILISKSTTRLRPSLAAWDAESDADVGSESDAASDAGAR